GVFLLYGLTALPDFDGRWGVSLASIVVALGWIALAGFGFRLLRDPPAPLPVAALATVLIVVRVAFALFAVGRTSTGDP
ncbi:hypothetical protein AAEJ42_23520, partial [Shewanella algae]